MTNSQHTPLAEFMAERSITGNVRYRGLEVDSTDGWDHHEFRFDLNIDGEPYLHNARYFAGTGHNPQDVTIEDCFQAILSDVTSVEGYDDWADWADELSLVTDAKTAKKAQTDFAEIKARASLLREAIGEDSFGAALEIES